MKKVAITGATGFIGSHTADFFLTKGKFLKKRNLKLAGHQPESSPLPNIIDN